VSHSDWNDGSFSLVRYGTGSAAMCVFTRVRISRSSGSIVAGRGCS
jgi:hypothetical protein